MSKKKFQRFCIPCSGTGRITEYEYNTRYDSISRSYQRVRQRVTKTCYRCSGNGKVVDSFATNEYQRQQRKIKQEEQKRIQNQKKQAEYKEFTFKNNMWQQYVHQHNNDINQPLLGQKDYQKAQERSYGHHQTFVPKKKTKQQLRMEFQKMYEAQKRRLKKLQQQKRQQQQRKGREQIQRYKQIQQKQKQQERIKLKQYHETPQGRAQLKKHRRKYKLRKCWQCIKKVLKGIFCCCGQQLDTLRCTIWIILIGCLSMIFILLSYFGVVKFY